MNWPNQLFFTESMTSNRMYDKLQNGNMQCMRMHGCLLPSDIIEP